VRALDFHPDGLKIFTGADDNDIVVWDVESGAEVARFEGHFGPVRSLAVSDDGTRLFSGSGDRTARAWDIETGLEIRRFEGPDEAITSVDLSANGRRALTGSEDGTLRVWRIDPLEDLVTWALEYRHVRPLTPNECSVFRVPGDCESTEIAETVIAEESD
jgi:WD40 repeat protein